MRATADFQVLGPLATFVNGREIDLGGLRQRAVLAVLLLHQGQVLTIDRLVDVVWRGQAPPTARNQVKTAIFTLREIFRSAGIGTVIETRSRGYVIDGLGPAVDLNRFDTLVKEARSAADTGEVRRALHHARDALTLWRGDPLPELSAWAVDTLIATLVQRRLNAIELLLGLHLAVGEHGDAADEAAKAVAEYPNRERFWVLYMQACYRDGNRTEALAVFRAARRHLVDEFGLDPGPELQAIHRAVLSGADPHSVPSPTNGAVARLSAGAPPPCVLPPAIADFVGRADELRRIHTALTGASLAMPVVAITGRPGVGKSALAVHAGHQLRSVFPDGQLYVDFRALDADEVTPAGALRRFLRMLGRHDPDVTAGLDELAERFRALLVNRRMLVVLDNVADEAQALPLLPGLPTCGVVLTTRTRPVGLAGATVLDVDCLDGEESSTMMARICGEERVSADPVGTRRVAELCGGLPLALRVAASQLAVRPHWTPGYLARRLTDEDGRLNELRVAHLDVRNSFERIYRSLDPEPRRLFRLLGSLDVPHTSSWVAAAVLDSEPAGVEPLLERLVDAALVDVVAHAPRAATEAWSVRYRFHQLIRLYARERARAEEGSARLHESLGRAFTGWLSLAQCAIRAHGDVVPHAVEAADGWRMPDDVLDAVTTDPTAWLRTERSVLPAVVRQAATLGLRHLADPIATAAADLGVDITTFRPDPSGAPTVRLGSKGEPSWRA